MRPDTKTIYRMDGCNFNRYIEVRLVDDDHESESPENKVDLRVYTVKHSHLLD